MRRLCAAWLCLWAATAHAQAPQAWTLLSYRVDVHVSEDLEPDLLRALARPNTVLWMETRSNALKASVLERLPLFPESYVQMRAPILTPHGKQLEKLTRVGVWLRAEDLTAPSRFRLGIRPLAVHVEGELEDALTDTVRAARPSRIDWTPGANVSLGAWAAWVGLPGLKTFRSPPSFSWAGCSAVKEKLRVEMDLRAASVTHLPAPACGFPTVAWVPPSPLDELLRALSSRESALQLRVDVGADAEAARAVVQLLEKLETAAGVTHVER